MLNIFEEKVLKEMSGKEFTPHPGEGVIYIKVVGLKPKTIAATQDLTEIVNAAHGVILAGRLDEIQAQLNIWFNQLKEDYHV